MNPLIVAPVLDIGRTLIDQFFPNKEEARRAEADFLTMVAEGELKQVIAQLEINAREAAHPSVFVAGWRPFVGWVCGTGFAVQFVIAPIAEWLAALSGHPVKFPELDMETLLTLLGGLLGLGGLRTFEKLKGANRRH